MKENLFYWKFCRGRCWNFGGLLAEDGDTLGMFKHSCRTAIPFAITLVEPQFQGKKLEKSFKAILNVVKYTLVENKLLRWFTLFSAITGVATLSMAWFAQPFFNDVDVPIKWFGILWAILNFSVGISSYHAHRFESIFNRNTLLLFIGVGIAFCYVFIGFFRTNGVYSGF